MSGLLLVSHDAGGTVPPMLALAEAAVARGHDVVWLGQPSIEERAVAAGCRFSPFRGVADYEGRVPIEDQFSLAVPLMVGAEIGDEVLALADRNGCDLVVVDANLAGAAAAAESDDRPSAVLLHSMYATFVETWFADFWPFLAPGINDVRRRFGLGPCDSWAEVFAGHDRLVSVVPAEFDAPVADPPARQRHHGFLVPTTQCGTQPARFPDDDLPSVLVGLSTTYQRQEGLLQAVLDALGSLEVSAVASTSGQVDPDTLRCPPNVVLRDHVDHRALLADTDCMVTHTGLGSVAAALSQGVPLVCVPLGRDQHLNARRTAHLGAGIDLGADADPGAEPSAATIAAAVHAVLTDRSYREGAGRVAEASREFGGPAAAVADLESLIPG
jgi:UDP:flavonoid glycosyltransferase YjiC (YdhE family)